MSPSQPLPTRPVARHSRIAVLIATHNRPELLASRALTSVAAQTRLPDRIVLVDDSEPALRPANRDAAARLQHELPGVPVDYLENTRSPGPSGAWNTGLEFLASSEDPEALFVAVLDDDDAWETGHLACCEETAALGPLDMVAAGLIRHDEATPEGRRQSIPERLRAEDFLVGNPHLQGSNLFVRLRALMEAGLFDEALPSTTDRDLCIRLADLCNVRFGGAPHHTVHHYAETGRGRVSDPHSQAKHAGLDGFWHKYRGRMSAEVRDKFLERAARLFGWHPTPEGQVSSSVTEPLPSAGGGNPAWEGELAFVVGIIADAGAASRVENLLMDLLELARSPEISGMNVVLLENGPRPEGTHPLEELTRRMRTRGLRCWLVTLEQQHDDAARSIFGAPFGRGWGRASIAVARTLLQRYLYSFAHTRSDAVVWILDDDKRLDAWMSDAQGRLTRARPPLVSTLLRLRASGVHVVLGEDTGAPPLPPASTLRGQLVDLHHHLHWLGGLPLEAPLPDRSAENARIRHQHPDYYYDLSREGAAPETPFWLVPEHASETVGEGLERIAARLPNLLMGEPLFRPLVHDGVAGDPVETAADSIRRGGSTFIFDVEALADAPNTAPTLEGRHTRRSDMLWALINTHAAGRRMVRASVPVRHERGDLAPRGLDLEVLLSDLRGAALYRAVEELLRHHRTRGNRQPLSELDFDEAGLERAMKVFRNHLRACEQAVALHFARIRGVLRAARALLDPTEARWASWHASPRGEQAARSIAVTLDHFLRECRMERIQEVLQRLAATDLEEVRHYLWELPETVKRYRQASSRSDGMNGWIEQQRIELARSQLERMCGLPPDAALLGSGYEGVVFAAGSTVFKYFDAWKVRASPSQRAFLRKLIHRWPDARALYPLQALQEDGVHAVLEYPYEPTEPYAGSHAEGLVRLLSECKRHGIVFRNITPKNLRVSARGLRLVDYGSDIVPYEPDEFLKMCRRAWLTWRWHHRPDLKELLRRSSQEETLPELSGIERLLQAITPVPAAEQLDAMLEDAMMQGAPQRILDYGCGKGRLAERVARRGVQVVGYDPAPELAARWERVTAPGLVFTSERSRLEQEPPFDRVVCSRVLCVLEDEASYATVLRDLRRLVKDGGQVLLTVCNPFFTLGGSTPFQRRLVPPGVSLEDTFAWEKEVSESGQRRRDIHRPLDRLRLDLLRVGLAIEFIAQTETVDLERLEPSSDFLLLRLRPLPTTGPRVSLMVKTCAMEWETIEHQVRHLVRQLEGPRTFCERVLVVDPRLQGFERQYTHSDAESHAQAAARLLREGWVDRIIHGPAEPGECAALNSRWFGVASTATHAANGSQAASTLAGFEACSGEYVLQVDSDLLIGRRDPSHDFLGEFISWMAQDPHALTTSLNIFRNEAHPLTASDGSTPWRVEVRAALFHRGRLLAARPFPNEATGALLDQAWYRALDQRVRESPWRSYRGGSPAAFFIHPPNPRKRDSGEWMALLDRVEDGYIPACQEGHVDLQGSTEEWLGPPRSERFIFLVQGRNVPPGRFLRCLESMQCQHRRDWGAIVIDDGSSPSHAAFLQLALAPYRDRITLLRCRIRRGKLAGLAWAVRHVIKSPDSVVVTLDADDALLGPHVLDRLAREYDQGADATVGSMLRTDKHTHYPVNLVDPRGHRGGTVWQHLRTFQKRLFDAVPDDSLRVSGHYVEVANDWAVMLPVIELATRPVYIPEPLYLHEPSGNGKGPDRARREATIAALMAKPRLNPRNESPR